MLNTNLNEADLNELAVRKKPVSRLPMQDLSRQCQKLGHRDIGTWMARRISRPVALRITWLVSPWGISAHTATLIAWGIGLAAALTFCSGSC